MLLWVNQADARLEGCIHRSMAWSRPTGGDYSAQYGQLSFDPPSGHSHYPLMMVISPPGHSQQAAGHPSGYTGHSGIDLCKGKAGEGVYILKDN